MRLIIPLVLVAIVNWYLSVPVTETPASEPKPERPEGSYAIDALIFTLCLAGVLYQRKQKRDAED